MEHPLMTSLFVCVSFFPLSLSLALMTVRQAKVVQRIIAHNTTIMALGNESSWREALVVLERMSERRLGSDAVWECHTLTGLNLDLRSLEECEEFKACSFYGFLEMRENDPSIMRLFVPWIAI